MQYEFLSPFLASMPELYVNNTNVQNNTQHGMFLENVRNFLFINASNVLHNEHGAGIRVLGGAGM